MSEKEIPENVIERWKALYYVGDPVERILNTHTVSCEAKECIKTHGEISVQKALREVVKGDRGSAAKLARVQIIPKAMIDKAVRQLKKSWNEREKHRSNTTPDQRGKRAKGGVRVKRADGFSQTHLLLLASVEEKEKRVELLRRSLEECWGTKQLRGEIKKLATSPVARPSLMAYTIQQQAGALAELLADVDEETLLQAVDRIKPADREAAIQNYDLATQTLTEISYCLVDKAGILARINKKIKMLDDKEKKKSS